MKPALFLDRDGVINHDFGYVHKIEDFKFVDGIFDICRQAAASGMSVVVVTNQAGIGRGYYTEEQFHSLTEWMKKNFAEKGVTIDGVYHCPFHPTHGIGRYKAESHDRKPNPGMILRASEELDLSLENSVIIGDTEKDIEAGRRAGIGTTILLGKISFEAKVKPDFAVTNLQEASRLLFSQANSSGGSSAHVDAT